MTTLRHIGQRAWQVAKHVGPVFLSAGLVAWMIWSVGPHHLLHAARSPAEPWLILATVIQMIVLFLFDTVTLWWLFSQPNNPISYRALFRARADSILWSAFSLELGQGAFAWTLSSIQHRPLSNYLSRCVILGIFDFGSVQFLALIGSFLHQDPLPSFLRWIPIVSLGGLVVLALLVRLMPERWKSWLIAKPWGSWLAWWSWRHAVLLAVQRVALFSLVLVYAGVCLAICGLHPDMPTVVGVIPFVMIAEGLPGTAGLGERETALVYLLHPAGEDQRAMLLAFGLTWSFIVILSRLAIGLASRALPRSEPRTGVRAAA